MKDDQDPVRCPQSEMQPRRGGVLPFPVGEHICGVAVNQNG